MKTAAKFFLLLILLSSCVILRKKELKNAFAHVDTDPINYCFTVKTKITDILSVKAKIGNQTSAQNFMFDTGAPLTYKFKTKDSFNIAAKRLLRLGPYKADYGTGSINFGNVKFNNVGFLVTDQILGDYEEVDGLIGSSMLQTSVCELNFADSTIKISNDIKNFTNTENCYSGTFESLGTQGTPVVKIVIGKDTSTAFIDTGESGLIKFGEKEKISLEMRNKREAFSNRRYFGGPDKDHFSYRSYYQLRRMKILGMEIDSMVIMQYPEYYGRNCIGLAFLKKFIVTIDWIHHKIYLKPISTISFKQNIYTYGFNCRMYDKQLRVLEIYKGTDAEKAGIKSGDVIVSINKITDLTDKIISIINDNTPSNDSIQIEIKDKSIITLKKQKLFD